MNQINVPARVASAPPRPQASARPSGWTGGRITALVGGCLIACFALVVLGVGGVGVWADLTQREGGYVTSSEHQFSTAGSALATERTHLGSAGVGWLYSPSLLGKVRIRVTPVNSGSPLFVGVGPSADVERYLAGVKQTVITDFWGKKTEAVGGGAAKAAPATQGFWAATTTGPGARNLVWKSTKGSWTVVVMNADGRPGIDVKADLGARLPAVLWISIGLLLGGAVFLAGGTFLIVGAIRRRRAARA